MQGPSAECPIGPVHGVALSPSQATGLLWIHGQGLLRDGPQTHDVARPLQSLQITSPCHKLKGLVICKCKPRHRYQNGYDGLEPLEGTTKLGFAWASYKKARGTGGVIFKTEVWVVVRILSLLAAGPGGHNGHRELSLAWLA